MICYRDRSYCSDQEICDQRAGTCHYILSEQEARRAEALGIPICWMSHKDTCTHFIPKETP